MPRGRFVTIEGVDGSGKTTLVNALAQHYGWTPTKEPTTDAPKARDLGALERVFLFLADRAHHVEILQQNLKVGWDQLCDRYHDSTVVYQLEELYPALQRTMFDAAHLAKLGLEPDLTILLDIDPNLAMQRIIGRNAALSDAHFYVDFNALPTIKQLNDWVLRYRRLAELEPNRIKTIKVDGMVPDEVLVAAIQLIDRVVVKTP